MSAHENDVRSHQTSSVFGVRVAETVEVQSAKLTGEQLAFSFHPSELQLLTAVNDLTSGQLWLLCRMRLVWNRTCEIQLYVYAGSNLDASMQSLSEEELVISENILAVAEYADDINQHLRESEVSNWYLKFYKLSHLCLHFTSLLF